MLGNMHSPLGPDKEVFVLHKRLQQSGGVLILLPRGKPVRRVSDNRSIERF